MHLWLQGYELVMRQDLKSWTKDSTSGSELLALTKDQVQAIVSGKAEPPREDIFVAAAASLYSMYTESRDATKAPGTRLIGVLTDDASDRRL